MRQTRWLRRPGNRPANTRPSTPTRSSTRASHNGEMAARRARASTRPCEQDGAGSEDPGEEGRRNRDVDGTLEREDAAVAHERRGNHEVRGDREDCEPGGPRREVPLSQHERGVRSEADGGGDPRKGEQSEGQVAERHRERRRLRPVAGDAGGRKGREYERGERDRAG